MSQYYVIQVITGRELNVKEIFLKDCTTKFLDLNAKIIIPQVSFVKHFRKTSKIVDKPILPGYVLLKCNDLTNELYYSIKKITGVIRLFRTSIYYEEVKKFLGAGNEVIRRIKKRMELTRRLALEKGKLKIIFKRIFRRRQAVKVNYQRKSRYIPLCLLVRLLN